MSSVYMQAGDPTTYGRRSTTNMPPITITNSESTVAVQHDGKDLGNASVIIKKVNEVLHETKLGVLIGEIYNFMQQYPLEKAHHESKADKSQGLWTDRAFGYMTAGFVLAGALKVSKMAPLFVDYGIAPLAVKAGLVKSTAHFALSKLATVGSTVCFGYCIPAILLPFLLKCCYDARSMMNSADDQLKNAPFKTRFKGAALQNLGFVCNGMLPAVMTVTSIAALGGLLYLDMLVQQNK